MEYAFTLAQPRALTLAPSAPTLTPLQVPRDLVVKMLIKTADLSNTVKPFDISRQWAICVTEEFFEQGDLEKASARPVSRGRGSLACYASGCPSCLPPSFSPDNEFVSVLVSSRLAGQSLSFVFSFPSTHNRLNALPSYATTALTPRYISIPCLKPSPPRILMASIRQKAFFLLVRTHTHSLLWRIGTDRLPCCRSGTPTPILSSPGRGAGRVADV